MFTNKVITLNIRFQLQQHRFEIRISHHEWASVKFTICIQYLKNNTLGGGKTDIKLRLSHFPSSFFFTLHTLLYVKNVTSEINEISSKCRL